MSWQPFADLINSKGCTNVWKRLNWSDLQQIAKTCFKNGVLSGTILINLYFEPEKYPAEVFLEDTIVFWARKASRRGLLGG